MEEYMMKKRMQRKIRNDYEEHDDYETEFIYTEAKKWLSKKVLLLGFLLAFAAFCAINRRKGGKNEIILVKDSEYRQNKKLVEQEKKKAGKKKKTSKKKRR